MRTADEDSRLVRELIGTAEAMGQAMSPSAAAMMVGDLDGVPLVVVQQALRAVRSNHRGRLTFQAIRERIVEQDGRPERDEAWGLALQSMDERDTVVWTDEIQCALEAARPILRAGDKIGARMAFLGAYDRLLRSARDEGRACGWVVSNGWDGDLRHRAIENAVRLQRLPMDRALLLGYDPAAGAITPDGQAIAGLLLLTSDEKTVHALHADEKIGAKPSPEVVDRLRELRQAMVDNAAQKAKRRQEAADKQRRDLQDRKDAVAAEVQRLQAQHQ